LSYAGVSPNQPPIVLKGPFRCQDTIRARLLVAFERCGKARTYSPTAFGALALSPDWVTRQSVCLLPTANGSRTRNEWRRKEDRSERDPPRCSFPVSSSSNWWSRGSRFLHR